MSSTTTTLAGTPVVLAHGSLGEEMAALRGSVGLSESPHVVCARLAGEAAYDVLDAICPASLYVRDGQLLHTLLLRDDGTPLADAYVGNDDGAYLLLVEGLAADALEAHVGAHAAGRDATLEILSGTHSLLSLNGPFAWELLSEVAGPEIIGFPYLSFYRPEPDRIYFRAGKTGEFGFDLLIPHTEAPALITELLDRGQAFDLARVGVAALWHAALENGFYNPFAEAQQGLGPVELQLQWRLAPDKDYVGAAAVRARAADPARRRVTSLVAREPLAVGEAVVYDGEAIGRVISAAESMTAGHPIATALLDVRFAHSGIDAYRARRADGSTQPVWTVSPPFVNNLSLFVNPQRHTYGERAELRFPGHARRGIVPPEG